MEEELRQLDAGEVRRLDGGVEFAAALADLYRANLHLRTAGRVLVRLGSFHAEEFWELEKRAAKLEWERYLAPGQPVDVRATCHKSRLYHSDGVAERVALAIGQRLGQPAVQHAPSEDEQAGEIQLVNVRLDHDECTISLDSSGELLHRRGYRLQTAKAPLRENLAAGLLMASGWAAAVRRPAGADPVPLLDPFCGSGTIAIEAALLALNLPPGRGRRFAFMNWPGFQAAEWQAVARAATPALPATPVLIMGSDRDEGAIEAARANARRAGVAEHVTLQCRPFSAIEPPNLSGWVVTNPPYGLRLGPSEREPARGRPERSPLRRLYSALGEVLRERCPAWQVAMLTADPELAWATGLGFDPARAVHTLNGGLRVTLWRGRTPPLSPPPAVGRAQGAGR
ncbi:MAG: hypothetical protein JNK29_17110 [Anaerolineales bacterium]|nr:hypothetical protein [Anaerolineales bacterium]